MVPTCASRSHGWSLEKAFTHARFSTNPCDGRAAFAAAMDQIDTADMAELDAREGGLESLTRRVDWEALHMQPRCRARGQEVLDQMATVKGRALSVQDSTPTEQSTKRARPAPWEQPWIPRGFLRTRVTASRRLREMREVNITHMPQLCTRELLPDALVGVQLQGIRRQALQVQPRRRAVGQEPWMVWRRWIGEPFQMRPIWPDTSRSRCSRTATTSTESIAWSWQGHTACPPGRSR